MGQTNTGRIPEDFIQSVLDKTDIVSLIQESVSSLKKNGANYSACCPFHQEKTPSFTVSPTKQFFHCFGCGANGDAIGFLTRCQNLPFIDAIEALAGRLGLTVPLEAKESAKREKTKQLGALLDRVSAFYQAQFRAHAEGTKAIEYLKKRGLSGQVAKQFGLGFAPPGWDNVLKQFNQETVLLEQTGMIIKHETGRYYDRFRDRIMFPIRNPRGEVIAFGGRVMGADQPKYLNSPESEVFHKSHCIYGLFEALKSKTKWQRAIVVEGYMDVVALAQYGIEGAVATMGTAVTTHHVAKLFRHVPEIVFCFDGDQAGRTAASKALVQVLPQLKGDHNVRFAHLPKGEDPDSYIRRYGQESFLALLQNSAPLSNYFFELLTREIPPDSVDNGARLANKARGYLEQIPAGTFKEMMYEQLAQLVHSSTQVVRGQQSHRRFYGYRDRGKPKITLPPPPNPLPPAFIASAILMRAPALISVVKAQTFPWQQVKGPGMDNFAQLVALLDKTDCTREQVKEKMAENGLSPHQESVQKVALLPDEGLEAELSGALKRLFSTGRQQFAEKLLQKAKNSELSVSEKELLKKILAFKESM